MGTKMQGYAPLPAGTTLKDSLAPLLANDAAAISHNSGTAFPTDNLIVGMECYRTDLGLKHRLISTNPVTWVALNYLPIGGGLVGKVIEGWDPVGAPTLRIVDDTSGFSGGGLSVESNRPMIQFIDRTTGQSSARLRLTAGALSIEHDDGTRNGVYTAGINFRSSAGVMAVGGAPNIAAALAVRTAFTAQTVTSSQYGASISPTFNEFSTVAGYGLSVTPQVKPAIFTMANLYGVAAAAPQVQGNMATVQNYDAFVALNPADFSGAPTLVTAARLRFDTSAANTNKWNLYADGSAPNYLNGKLLLGATADDGSGAKLQVTGMSSFTDFLYARKGLNLEGAAAATVVPLNFRQSGLTRFTFATDANTNLQLSRFDDAGVFQDVPLAVNRATGQINLNGSTVVDGAGMKTPGAATLVLNAKSGSQAALLGQHGGSPRWNLVMPDGDGHLRLYRNPTGTQYVTALSCNLSTGATGVVSLTADSLIAASGYMTTQNGIVSYSTASSGRAAFNASGNNGQAWEDWSGSGQPALQVDMPGWGSAYPIVRGTRWGGKHIFAIHGYEGANNNDQRISFALTQANQFVFNANGQGWATGGWQGTSDARLKTGREVIQDAGAKLETLTGETYYRIDLKDGNRRYAGVIAQAVQAVVPEAISELDGILGVDIAGVVALLVEALKETRADARALQERVYQIEKG